MGQKANILRGGTVLQHNHQDQINVLKGTDILIKGNTIVQIGVGLGSQLPAQDVEIIDCRDKIISPGSIDTHHHLWQTQLKGRYADDTLMDYLLRGMMQAYNYTHDIFWGQLGGALECIDAGTTFVVDHMHAIYSPDHTTSAQEASEVSGLRSVFAYVVPSRFRDWTKSSIVPELDFMPEWALKQVEELAAIRHFTHITHSIMNS